MTVESGEPAELVAVTAGPLLVEEPQPTRKSSKARYKTGRKIFMANSFVRRSGALGVAEVCGR